MDDKYKNLRIIKLYFKKLICCINELRFASNSKFILKIFI